MPPTIDAHQHFWQLSRPGYDYDWLDDPAKASIRRDYLPEHLAPLIGSVGVERTVFVQTQHNLLENAWVLELAEKNPFVAGVVGWVDLASPACEEQVQEFWRYSKFVGVRHITHDEPDDDFIVRPEVLRGLAVLEQHRVPFDLLFHVKHLKHATTLAHRFPDLPMVIDHLAKPQIKAGRIDDWLPLFNAAAECPNLYCKLSGMVTEADWQTWTPADLRPYVETALELFGPERCMFGSDWPVCELAGSYEQVYRALDEVLPLLSNDEPRRDLRRHGHEVLQFEGVGSYEVDEENPKDTKNTKKKTQKKFFPIFFFTFVSLVSLWSIPVAFIASAKELRDRLSAVGDGHGPLAGVEFLGRVDPERGVNRRVPVGQRDRLGYR